MLAFNLVHGVHTYGHDSKNLCTWFISYKTYNTEIQKLGDVVTERLSWPSVVFSGLLSHWNGGGGRKG